MEVEMSDFEFWKDLGNIFDAILNYQKKNVEFNNRFINPWIRLGNIFDRDDQHKEAVQAYKHAIELDPDNASNWSDLGDALFKMGSFDDALAVYQKAAELDPKAGWPVSNLALTLVSLGRHEQAIPLFLESIDLFTEDKDKAVAWNRLGNAYRKLNDYQNAFLAFQNADALDGENTGFHDQLDETTETNTMVAPDEVLVQMTDEQAVVDMSMAIEEGISETLVEAPQPKTEVPVDATGSVITLAGTEETIAIAPNMEMVIEETVSEVAVESVAPAAESIEEPVAQVIEEVVAWSKARAVEETSVEVNVEMKADEEAVKVEVQVTHTHTEEAPVVEAIAEEIVEEAPVLETAEPVAGEEVKEIGQIVEEVEEVEETTQEETAVEEEPLPSWITEETTETDQEEIVEEQAVTRVTVEVTTDISATSTEMVETYTELISTNYTLEDTQPMKAVRVEIDFEPAASEEQVEGTAAQPEVQEETGGITQKSATVMLASEPVAESAEVVEEAATTEAPYEEYLKDAIEPVSTLTDHLEDVHGETPVTRVSESGEVRIAMDTENAHVWNELGNVYFNSGACDDAIAAYGKAIELDRQFAWPYSNLALAYVQKNRFAESILLYQRSIELFVADKDKAVTWNRLGNVYRRLNDYSNAIAAYQTADELDPDNATLSLRSHYGLLGNLYMDQKPNYVS
jgi:tetratricopeptide (TPR) repeat protein